MTTIGPVALPPPPVMLARVIVTEIVTAEDLMSVEVITALEETLDWTAVSTVVTHLTTIGPAALHPPPVMLARVTVTEIVTAEDLWSVEVITAMEETLDWTAVNTGEDQDGVLQILLKTWKMMM